MVIHGDPGVRTQDDSGDFGDALIDVTGLSLHDLDAIGESSLAQALRRVLEGEQTEPVAGFSARI